MKTAFHIAGVLLASLCFLSSAMAHIAISYPPSQGGPWSKNPVKEVHAWIGYKGKKFPCGNVLLLHSRPCKVAVMTVPFTHPSVAMPSLLCSVVNRRLQNGPSNRL